MQAEKHKTTATKRPAKSTTRKRLAAGPTVRVERPKATATSSPAKHKYIPVKHYRNERDEAPQKPAAAPFIYHPTASENVNVLLPSKYKHNIPKDLIWQMGNCHTAHVTNLKGLFSTYTEYPRGQKIIRVRSGAQKLPNLKVLGYGEIKLRFPGIDGKTREITIQALYSSMAPYNMLSPKLLSLDMILDNKGGWALKDKEGVVAVGPMRSQLPFLRTYGRGENGEDIGMKEEDIRATASDGRIPDGLMMPHTGGICRLEGGAIVTNIYDYTRAIEVYESQRTRDEAVFNIILPRILMGESAPGVLNL